MSEGIEGRWQMLNEQREELKDRIESLERQLAHAKDEIERAKEQSQRLSNLVDTDVKTIAAERDHLKERLAEVKVNLATRLLTLDESESEAMHCILKAFNIIANEWKLQSNREGLAIAAHGMQQFVIQHMLSRRAPSQWGSWWSA